MSGVAPHSEEKSMREMVEELQTTVTRLREELALQRQSATDAQLDRPLLILDGAMLSSSQVRTLIPEAREAIQRIVPQIQADPRLTVMIEGHSDSSPIAKSASRDFKNNTDLSLHRARLVAAVLIGEGVDASRLRLKGWGDARPLAPNDTAAGRDRNRRVEIRLVPPSLNP